MAVLGQNGLPVKDLQALFSRGVIGGCTDAELLERFVSQCDQAVFETII